MPALAEPLRIVAVGGGTGLSSLLRGLKQFVTDPVPRPGAATSAMEPRVEITAVVTVTDDGGSSGRLRRELAMLPPGDIRNCMVALSEDEGLMSQLFQYRFAGGRGLKGHSFGNLFLTALAQLTGDFAKAVALSAEVLATRGRIFPSTSANVALEAVLEDGSKVRGETMISRSRSRIRRIQLHPHRCKPLPETLEAIRRSDLICLGPGSLYTSVIPNLLVEGVAECVRGSRARKAYFVNLMWQPGETMGYTAADHVEAIRRHAGEGLVEYVVVNSRPVPARRRRRYAEQDAFTVAVDWDRLESMGLHIVTADLLDSSEQVRHAPERTAALAVHMAMQARRERSRRARNQPGRNLKR